jgi:hypothetical protein
MFTDELKSINLLIYVYIYDYIYMCVCKTFNRQFSCTGSMFGKSFFSFFLGPLNKLGGASQALSPWVINVISGFD